ncbi:MAG: aldo/keto reductase [Candidatus Bathyarchaeia archaeon]
MQYVNLGRAGVKVSRICLGCMSFGNAAEWMIEIDEARPIVERALDLGVNFFDTANVYSRGRSEEILGELLNGRRDDVVIATKVHGAMGEGPNDRGLSRLHILRQVEGSLKRLRTDYVDLYQTHRWDYGTPIEETLKALNDLVRLGKVRYIGASSMYAWQFAKALWTSERLGLERFVSMQNHYNLCYREEEREMIPLCKDQGVALIPWSPLARGFLTGRYKRGEVVESARLRSDRWLKERFFRPEDFDVVERVQEVAKEKGVSMAQVALAWLWERGVTAPIIGVTKVQHVEEAVAALDVHLTPDEARRLEEPYKPHPIIGHT